MTARIFVATAYFDGERGHGDGPYTILVDGERIVDVVGGDRLITDMNVSEPAE